MNKNLYKNYVKKISWHLLTVKLEDKQLQDGRKI